MIGCVLLFALTAANIRLSRLLVDRWMSSATKPNVDVKERIGKLGVCPRIPFRSVEFA
jgi:hypothetical protein